jgi:hypothetical protein
LCHLGIGRTCSFPTQYSQFAALFIIAYLIYGNQPQVSASAESLIAFYHGDRVRILIATVLDGFAVLNLMWFAAALRTTLADAGRDGWGAAATASSAALAGLLILLTTVSAGLAYSIAGSGNPALLGALNDITWAGVVLSSFPRAMLTTSAAFGLWRAGLISNGLCGRRCGRCTRSAGWDHVAERRILGTRWSLFPVRIATHLSPMADDCQPRPFNS